jgi:hypothetical protein
MSYCKLIFIVDYRIAINMWHNALNRGGSKKYYVYINEIITRWQGDNKMSSR